MTTYRTLRTGMRFESDQAWLQRLSDRIAETCASNRKNFAGREVLIEGNQYRNVWLETQPMGGEMYARLDAAVALNNQVIFMDHQAENGRLPGMISQKEDGLKVDFAWMQGCFFPLPAYRMAAYIDGDKTAYRQQLYASLEAFDRYLWAYRDSDGDGCLETWCVWDTGEDDCSRFLPGSVNEWGGEEPPLGHGKLPYESMDFMGFSCQCRSVLAQLSRDLGNGRADYWEAQAQAVRDKIRSYLWVEEKGACYDRDADNKIMDILLHNNLRVMYFGGMSQDMADTFIRDHMFNPEEFWTPLPLPSIAVNDAFFRNIDNNNWSGPPQGLTYQRAIDALMNYGHHAEVVILGKKWLKNCDETGCFAQSYDPYTGKPGKQAGDYGPAALAALEYLEMLTGMDRIGDQVQFSGARGMGRCRTEQRFGEAVYTLTLAEDKMHADLDGQTLFSCDCGVRVVWDEAGGLPTLIGIEEKPVTVTFVWQGQEYTGTICPNEQVQPMDGKLVTVRRVAFDYPF